MDKYFVCLANSYKRGGRCLAGIEVVISHDDHWKIVKNPDGSPRWIRPIDQTTEYGEVLEGEARFIPLLTVVKLSGVIPCPHEAHSEDVNYGYMMPIGMIRNSRKILELFLDNQHSEIFYTTDLAISPEIYAQGNYSLMLIHPERILFQEDPTKNRARYRLLFSYHEANYDFSITDPTFYELITKQPELVTSLSDVYLTLSIGLVYEGRHHKLIAGLIIPDKTVYDDDFTIVREGRFQEKTVCSFTKKERCACKRAFIVPSQEGLSVCIKKKNGNEEFILLDSKSPGKPWQKIKLRRAQIVIYQDSMGREIKRLRLIETTRSNLFNKILTLLHLGNLKHVF